MSFSQLPEIILKLRQSDQQIIDEAQKQIFELQNQNPVEFLEACADYILSNSAVDLFVSQQCTILIRNTLKPFKKTEFKSNWISLSSELQNKIKQALYRGLMFEDVSIRNSSSSLLSDIFLISSPQEKNEFVPTIVQLINQPEEFGEIAKLGGIQLMANIFVYSKEFLRECPEQCLQSTEIMIPIITEVLASSNSVEWNRSSLELLINICKSPQLISSKLLENDISSLFTSILSCFISYTDDIPFHQLVYNALYEMMTLLFLSLNDVYENIVENLVSDLDSEDSEIFDMACTFWSEFSEFNRNYKMPKPESDQEVGEKPDYISILVDLFIPKLLVNLSKDIEDDEMRFDKNNKRVPLSAKKLIIEMCYFNPSQIIEGCISFYKENIDNEQWRATSAALYALQTVIEWYGLTDVRAGSSVWNQCYETVKDKLHHPSTVVREVAYLIIQEIIDFGFNIQRDKIDEIIDLLFQAQIDLSPFDGNFCLRIFSSIVDKYELSEDLYGNFAKICFNIYERPEIFQYDLLENATSVIIQIVKKNKYSPRSQGIFDYIVKHVFELMEKTITVEMPNEQRIPLQASFCEIFRRIRSENTPNSEINPVFINILDNIVEIMQKGYAHSEIFNVIAEFIDYIDYVNDPPTDKTRIYYYDILLNNILPIIANKDSSLLKSNSELITKVFQIISYPSVQFHDRINKLQGQTDYSEIVAFCKKVSPDILEILISNLSDFDIMPKDILFPLLEAIGNVFSALTFEVVQTEFSDILDQIVQKMVSLFDLNDPEYNLPLCNISFLLFKAYIQMHDGGEDIIKFKKFYRKAFKLFEKEVEKSTMETRFYFINFLNVLTLSPFNQSFPFLLSKNIKELINQLKNPASLGFQQKSSNVNDPEIQEVVLFMESVNVIQSHIQTRYSKLLSKK